MLFVCYLPFIQTHTTAANIAPYRQGSRALKESWSPARTANHRIHFFQCSGCRWKINISCGYSGRRFIRRSWRCFVRHSECTITNTKLIHTIFAWKWVRWRRWRRCGCNLLPQSPILYWIFALTHTKVCLISSVSSLCAHKPIKSNLHRCASADNAYIHLRLWFTVFLMRK